MSALRIIQVSILLVIVIFFQSCFEVIEQVQFANDGSGNFQLTLNLSKSKTKISSVLKMETINGHPVPSKESIIKKLTSIGEVMEKTPGINNVRTSADMDNYIAVLSCNFINVTQLNKAIKNIKLKEKATAAMLEDNYSYDTKAGIFQRKNNFSLRKTYAGLSKADKEIFAGASYTSIFKFASDITGITNKNARLSANKKAVMQKETALDIITEKKSIENTINIQHQ
jgi:hypothetical protein